MTSYITVSEAINLLVKEVNEYYSRSEGSNLRLIAEEIDLDLLLVFSADAKSPSGSLKPLVALDGEGSATSSHRLKLKLRPVLAEGPLKISTDNIVEGWRR
jgi:Trypsin-co-occurring domain 2